MKTLTDRNWRGYTLDELQAQRKINDDKIATQKAILAQEFADLKTQRSSNSGIFKKMVNGLSYLDYAVLGVTAFKRISSLVSLFKRKK
ncbi:MAG: hypothetical protein HDT07_05100 [Bacteroidales bacterium]|nr:hypothetical protein [Bacteroidales bacterium]